MNLWVRNGLAGPVSGTSTVTFNIRAAHENANTGLLTCWVVVNHRDTGVELGAPSLQWNQGEAGPKSVSMTLAAQQTYTATVFCSIPYNATGAGTQIYSVWTS